MKIFIAFGYNPNDAWIRELVFPLARAFDAEVITGEDLHGKVITNEINERIAECDAFLGFLTRRTPDTATTYSTHPWVRDELVLAMGKKIPAVEVREKMVTPSGGFPGDRQFLEFDIDNKAALLVDLARLLSKWRLNLTPRRFTLYPLDMIMDVKPHIKSDKLECTYQFRRGNKESIVYSARPFRSGQGLCVDICNIPSEDAMVQVTVKGPQFEWNSNYESVELVSINLEKQ